jgi:hypothetical protein
MTDQGGLARYPGADLERRLAAALDVAARVVTVLAPAGYSAAGDPAADRAGRAGAGSPDHNGAGGSTDHNGAGGSTVDEAAADVSPEKVITETAILVLAASRVAAGRPDIARRTDLVARLLAPHARSERVRALMSLEPVVALEHGSAHLCLASAGHPAPACDRLLRGLDPAGPSRSVRPGQADLPGRERTPCRQLEQLWLRTLLRGWPSGEPVAGLRPALASSQLGSRLDALSGTRADAYAITHAVMFASDFGARPVALPRPRAAVLADLESALAASLDSDDYDVAGEVLACWPMLRLPWTPAAAFGLRVLTAAEDEAGQLPTPLLSPERFRRLDAAGRTSYALAATYHASYVMGLLAAALLRTGPLPVAAPSTRWPATAPRELEGYLAGRRAPRWREHWSRLAPGQQASLVPFVLTVALRQAVTDRRLAAVHDLLGAAGRWRLLAGPAPRQATRLLERVLILTAGDDAPAPAGAGPAGPAGSPAPPAPLVSAGRGRSCAARLGRAG